MTGPVVVDMAPFWREVAAPAALAVLAAAGYVYAAWRRPALRTPITSFRAWRLAREIRGALTAVKRGEVEDLDAWLDSEGFR